MSSAGATARAAEHAARASYARLLALLARASRDIAASEDALADGFRSALEVWPERGVPEQPDAWLLTAARRRLIGAARHDRVRAASAPALRLIAEAGERQQATVFPDDRLRLLFACTHPAVEPKARAPLMLQVVMGFDAARIASAFLVSPAAMAQRLVRAKAQIRETGASFELPEPEELPARLDAVLEAIYAAYGSAWDDVGGADPRRHGLAEEAIWLARLLAALLPQEPEAAGLLALLLHCEARRGARRAADGAFVPLFEQDPMRWSRPLIEEAERLLAAAARARRVGRYQLEAAIQSAHVGRRLSGEPDWPEILLLYDGLVAVAPTAGALVGRAAASAAAHGADAGWAVLGAETVADLAGYQPYWALLAELQAKRGHRADAAAAYERAAGLAEDVAVRRYLLQRRERMMAILPER